MRPWTNSIIAACVCAAFLVYAFLQHQRYLEARTAQEHAVLDRQLAENKLVATKATLPAAALSKSAELPAPPPRDLSRTIPMAASGPRPDISTLFKDNPILYDSYCDAFDKGLNTFFGAFFSLAVLTEQQMERFKQIVSKQMRELKDLKLLAAEAGSSLVNSPYKELEAQRVSQRDAALKELLGEANFDIYRNYRNNPVEWDQVRDVAISASRDGAPLDVKQAAQIVQLLSSTNLQLRVENGILTAPPDETYRRVTENIAKVLTPIQMQTYQRYLDSNRAAQSLMLKGQRRDSPQRH